MNKLSVTVRDETLPADLATLIEQLQTVDLPRLELAYKGLSGLHAVLSQLLAPAKPPPAPRVPIDAAELNEVEDHLRKLEDRVAGQGELLERIADEVAKLAARPAEVHNVHCVFPNGAPDAPAADAVPLAAVANDTGGPVPADLADVLPKSAEARGVAPAGRDDFREAVARAAGAVPAPAPGGARARAAVGRANRLAIARALAERPMGATELAAATGLPKGTVSPILVREPAPAWWVKGGELRSPYSLTDAGRAALTEAGYLLVPPAPEAPPAPAPEPEPEPEPARPELLDPKDRAVAQCRAIAEAIVAAGSDPLTLDQIARAAGLPIEVTQKRLNRFGPSSNGGIRYFCKSEKYPGCWRVTNSGEALAREVAPV